MLENKFQKSISVKELFSIAVLWHCELLAAVCGYVCMTVKIADGEVYPTLDEQDGHSGTAEDAPE